MTSNSLNRLFDTNVPPNNYSLEDDELKLDPTTKKNKQQIRLERTGLDLNPNLAFGSIPNNDPDLNLPLNMLMGIFGPQPPYVDEKINSNMLNRVYQAYFTRGQIPTINNPTTEIGFDKNKNVLTEALSSQLLTNHWLDCFIWHISIEADNANVPPHLLPNPETKIPEVIETIENTFAGTTGDKSFPILTNIINSVGNILWLAIASHLKALGELPNFARICHITRMVDVCLGGKITHENYDTPSPATEATVMQTLRAKIDAFQNFADNLRGPFNLSSRGSDFETILVQMLAGEPLAANNPGRPAGVNVPGYFEDFINGYDLSDPAIQSNLREYGTQLVRMVLYNIISGNFATTMAIDSLITSECLDIPGDPSKKYEINLEILSIPESQDQQGANDAGAGVAYPNNIDSMNRYLLNHQFSACPLPTTDAVVELQLHFGFDKYIKYLCNQDTTVLASIKQKLNNYDDYTKEKTFVTYQTGNPGNVRSFESLVGGSSHNKINTQYTSHTGGANNMRKSVFLEWLRVRGPNVLLCAQFLWNADVRGDILDNDRFVFKPFGEWVNAKAGPYGNYFILLTKFYYNYVSNNSQIYKNGTMHHDLIGTVYADTALVPTRGEVIGNSNSLNVLGGLNIQMPQVYSFLQGTLPFMQTVAVILDQNNINLTNTAPSANNTPAYSGSQAPPVLRGGSNDNYKVIVASVLGEDFKQYSNMIGGGAYVTVDVEPSKFNGKHLVSKLRKEFKLRIDQLKIKGITANATEVHQLNRKLNELEESLNTFEQVLMALKSAVVDRDIKSNVLNIKDYVEQYMASANNIKTQYSNAVLLLTNLN